MKEQYRYRIFSYLTITLAIGAMASDLKAGEIQFWQKDGCRGKLLQQVFGDHNRYDEVLTKSDFAENDEIRSVRLKEVTPGTLIELWDDSTIRDRDDWVRITINALGTYQINNIENNPHLEGLTFEKHGNGNLAGKVSRVQIFPPLPTVDYNVSLTTANFSGAETNDDVYIRLKGSEGESPWVFVNRLIEGPAFRQGATNSVVIKLPESIGKIEEVEVKKQFGGVDSWYLQYVGTSGPGDGGKTFDFDRWIKDLTTQVSRGGAAPK